MNFFQNKKYLQKMVSGTLLFFSLTFLMGGCFAKEQPKKTSTAKTVKLVYYKLYDEEDVIQPLIQQYISTHPNVQITYKKFTDPVEYENLIINELAEGEGPDVFSVPNYWFLRNVKKISPMPDNIMTVKQFGDTFVTVAQNDLVLRDPADGKVKIYGLPMSVDTLALYYNKATFDDKIPSQGKPAATWEGIKEDVFKLSKKDQSFERFEVAGIAMGRSDNILRAVDILYLLMLQYKANFYNANISQAQFSRQTVISATGISLNPAVEALKLYTSFALPANKNYSWNSYLADSKSPVKEIEAFAKGKVAMVFGYSYLYQQIINEVKDLKDKGVPTIEEKNIRVSAVPQVIDPNTTTEKRVGYANYYAETVSRTSANSNEAWDFLTFITSKENLKFYNEKTHRPTSRRDMINDQVLDPIYGVFAEQIGYAESLPIYDSVRYGLAFSRAIDTVLATGSPTDAMKAAEATINDMLPSEGLIPPAPKTTTSSTPAKTTIKTTTTTAGKTQQ